ncbi:MAG: hypothetical protein Q9199_002822 [Rusavskia elegans]
MSDYYRVFKVGCIDEEGLLCDEDDDKYSHAILDAARTLIANPTTELIHMADSEPYLNRVDMQFGVQELANDRLQELRIIGDQNELGDSVQLFSLFPKLPRLRRLYGHHVIGMNDEFSILEVSWPVVKELHFDASGIDGTVIKQLLYRTRGLKALYNKIGLFGDSDEGLYAPYLCISFLRNYALETLERLTLIDPPGLVTDNKKDIDQEMDFTTLRDFQVLRYAAVETSLFIDNYKIDQHEKNIAEYYSHKYEPDKKVLRLVDVLPPALETVVLHTPRNANDLAAMFRDLSQLKHERLPSLRSVNPKSKRPIEVDSKTKEECQQPGIEFEIRIGQY